MRKHKLLALVLALMMTVSMALAGCGNKSNTTPTTGDKGTTSIDKDQYLNLPAIADVASLDNVVIDDGYSITALNACMEGLVRTIEKDGNTVAEAAGAESWTTSPDGLKWTFKLKDHKWTDGKAVTANDYVYTIRRLLTKKVGAPYSYLYYGIKNGEACYAGKAKPEEVGVKAVDDKTLEFTLEQPIPFFLSLMAVRATLPQRQDIVEKEGKAYGQDPKKMVFNGPFVVDEWIHGNKIIFKKNPKYWDANSVKLDTVTISVVKEETPRMTMLKDGQLDVGGAKGKWMQELEGTGKFNIVKGVLPSTTYEMFNQNVPVFKSSKVRLAMSLALDREDIVKTLYEGRYLPAYGWIPDGIVVQDKINFRKEVKEPLKETKTKYTDLKALFKEGLKDIGMDPEKVVTIKYLSSGTDSTSKLFAEYRQKQWESKLPVKIVIDAVNDFPEFRKRMAKQEFEIGGQRWTGDYNDPMTFMEFFVTGYNGNDGQYANKEYDEILAKTRKESDPQKRFELFKQAEEILLVKDPAIAPGVYFDKNTYVEKYVKNFILPNFGADYEFKYAYTEGRK